MLKILVLGIGILNSQQSRGINSMLFILIVKKIIILLCFRNGFLCEYWIGNCRTQTPCWTISHARGSPMQLRTQNFKLSFHCYVLMQHFIEQLSCRTRCICRTRCSRQMRRQLAWASPRGRGAAGRESETATALPLWTNKGRWNR